MNQVSSCCKGSIEEGVIRDYPMNDRFGISYKTDVCGECGKEVEDILDTCDCCGGVSEKFIEVKLGDWCEKCVRLYAEDLMDRVTEDAVRTVTA